MVPPLNVNIETPLLIFGDRIIVLLITPAKEIKLVRPLNTDAHFIRVVSIDLAYKPNEAVW